MSILFDAKQAAITAHPDDKEKAVDLFIGYTGSSRGDIEYEIGETIEEYLFGK